MIEFTIGVAVGLAAYAAVHSSVVKQRLVALEQKIEKLISPASALK